MEIDNMDKGNETINTVSSSSKESEVEDLDAIKRFIEEQDDVKANEKYNDNTKENLEDINELSESAPKDIPDLDNCGVHDDPKNSEVHKLEEKIEKTENKAKNESYEETLSVATSVMNMILNESENKLEKKKEVGPSIKNTLTPVEKGGASVSLKVGSKVEAKDFCEDWYPAQIVEVDYDEMEVLVHYENDSKKHDEWISVSSPRLRPIGSLSKNPSVTPAMDANKTDNTNKIKDETKTEEKPKLTFAVGERCLARWRDNRRFVATVQKDLNNGNYEIIFDDGFHWTCKASRLYKMKQSSRIRDPLSVDTSMPGPSTYSTPSPTLYGAGPISASQIPPYHTHLFDPTRDYLGTKKERREMKRKLNIKEIFNIGQKRRKKLPKAKVSMSQETVKRKSKLKPFSDDIKIEIKTEIPDAVASIIGTLERNDTVKEEVKSEEESGEATVVKYGERAGKMENKNDLKKEENEIVESHETLHNKEVDPVVKEETKLEKFEVQDNNKHEEFMDKIKEVITKLEDGLNKVGHVATPAPEIQEVKETAETESPQVETTSVKNENNEQDKIKEIVPKVKKTKKLRLSQQKKVKRQVEKVKNELEEMKKQVEEMKKRMLMQTEELIKSPEMPESFLLPGEWCAKWVNGQPVGVVSEIECEAKDANSKHALPRRSVQVEDKRLPPGWTKHMVRRSFGNSAGKWDVVLVSPNNRRLHTKTEMRNYIENNPNEELKSYEHALLDFGVHLKLSRRMGWVKDSPNADNMVVPLPAGLLSSTSPLVKRRKLSINKSSDNIVKKKRKLSLKSGLPKVKKMRMEKVGVHHQMPGINENQLMDTLPSPAETAFDNSTLEDGYVYVGSLKVQIIENLLRCPAEGCFKNFRNNTLLQMHIKHYHRELRKMMGATPKVLDLAYARTTMPEEIEMKKEDSKVIKVKVAKLPKRSEELKQELKEAKTELQIQLTPIKIDGEKVPRSQDSPKLRNALINKPVKRPKVLLPVRRPEQIEAAVPEIEEDDLEVEHTSEMAIEQVEIPSMEVLDFETAISTHTVTKPIIEKKKKGDKKKKSFAFISKKATSEDDEWYGMNSDIETMSSFPRSETPDSKTMETKIEPQPVSSESNNEDQKDSNMYMYTENGERIKLVHMKREEIINCHCGFREEDGLMVQCELCLCWQHALCHNIQKESEVPEKYTCSICLNPRRGRRSQRFVHDQDRLYEGLLPAARPSDPLRRSHELSGNLVRIEHALHALRVKYYVATKKDHPKLYLWAKDWENGELNITQEKLHSDYSDLNIMMSNIGKENLSIKPDEIREMTLDMRTPPSSEEPDNDRYCQREGQIVSQSLLSGLLSSPSGASLDLPISTTELERLAKSVQAEESQQRVIVPQPEAAIENSACRERLLRHIQRCQALIDARLDSIDAQIAELESQDPSFEDDETADYFPRTKQTIQMLLRDLDTMEELGTVT